MARDNQAEGAPITRAARGEKPRAGFVSIPVIVYAWRKMRGGGFAATSVM
jgi:hypothetical protein